MRMIQVITLLLALPVSTWAEVKSEPLSYESGGVTFKGELFFDDAVEGRRPGVMVVHEWTGLNDYARLRARMLAELGYVALAADMYGEGKVTTDRKQAGEWAGAVKGDVPLMRARAEAGLAALRGHERVDSGKLAAIGYCFGGTTVLQLALGGADLAGVVSFHGGLPADPADPAKPVKAKVLVLHGGADPLVPVEEVTAFTNNMDAAGADWQLVAYGGAKHSFTNPDADKANMPPVGYQKAADERSWKAMQVFFDELFK